MRRRFTTLWALSLAAVFSASASDATRLELRNERFTLALGYAERGALVSLRAGDQELLASPKSPDLFTLSVSKKAAIPGDKFTIYSSEAKSFKWNLQRDGQTQIATLSYEGFAAGALRVTCTATAKPGDAFVRWRASVQVPDDLVLEGVRFPLVNLRPALGDPNGDDAAVLGATKGGVIRQPSKQKTGTQVSIAQPGTMAAQFGCYYQPQIGFFTAAFDGQGHPKSLILTRTSEGVEFAWHRSCFARGTATQEYDIVMTVFSKTPAAPADWRDAADLYKQWAITQPWCATPYAQRADVPAWMKTGPAMVRFGRDWLAEPARIERWLTNYWQKQFPSAPLITAYWGWEKIASWVTPDYFPVFPSDDQFTALVARTRPLGAHAFPWPSGYHWSLTYNKRPDGTFAWDDRQRFDRVARAHAVQNRDGKLYVRTPSWLAGGDTACLCGGDPWTIRWWNEDICVPLAQRGCELIQVDQVVGGRFPECFNPAHPHPAGAGPWQTAVFRQQLQTMLATMRKIQPDAMVCFEEPNEQFNHLVSIQDYRDCESPNEWASVFNYLYHEFLPTFQSNPKDGDLVMTAYCLANGQIPHLKPSSRDLEDAVLSNGAFEVRPGTQSLTPGWEQVHGYQGQNWSGRASMDAQEKHGGNTSLRLENTAGTDIVQVSQNLSVGEEGFAPGHKYRLSAWLKTGQMAKSNGINFGLFAAGMKSTGKGGRLPFPAAGSGWQRVSADFTVPTNATTLRIMIHLSGPATAWVDDMALEEILATGTATVARYSKLSPLTKLMQRWVELYHGEGQPWLQMGALLHPPQLECVGASYNFKAKRAKSATERHVPSVFHNAFRAPNGQEAVVLANATTEPQHVTLTWKGKTLSLDLPGADALLVK